MNQIRKFVAIDTIDGEAITLNSVEDLRQFVLLRDRKTWEFYELGQPVQVIVTTTVVVQSKTV